ncbi:MAG: hypothetical protein ABIZ49_06015 [Opitutaceae bacterium]
MKNLLRLTSLVWCVSAFFSFATAAEKPDPGQLAATVMVPEGLKAAEIQQSILLAGTGRGWSVKEKASGQIVLFLEQSGWRSLLTLTYDDKEIKIFSNSGKPDKNGVIKKQAIPTWVNFLKQDINKELGSRAFAK